MLSGGGIEYLLKCCCKVKYTGQSVDTGPATGSSLVTLAREVLEERWGQSLTGVGPREKRGGMDKSSAKFCYKERRGKCDRRLFYSWEGGQQHVSLLMRRIRGGERVAGAMSLAGQELDHVHRTREQGPLPAREGPSKVRGKAELWGPEAGRRGDGDGGL